MTGRDLRRMSPDELEAMGHARMSPISGGAALMRLPGEVPGDRRCAPNVAQRLGPKGCGMAMKTPPIEESFRYKAARAAAPNVDSSR